MRISKQHLKQIIDEEVTRKLSEVNRLSLKESLNDLRDLHLEDMIEFAKAYSRMGVVAQERLEELVQDATLPYDHAAWRVMMRDMSGLVDELDAMLDEWGASERER